MDENSVTLSAQFNGQLTKFYTPDPLDWADIQPWLFAPLLPWQQHAWQHFTHHFPNLPHAILFAGNAGTGKRAFVYRLIAWGLCQNRQNLPPNAPACGQCNSCHWLTANTHPNVYTIPTIAGITQADDKNSVKPDKEILAKKDSKKSVLNDSSPNPHVADVIKIDDIRNMANFAQRSSDGVRFVVIHQADAMTLGAANALLKTLEEPAQDVVLLLVTDTPSQLLPTIRSRLQQFNVSQMTAEQSLEFMQNALSTTQTPAIDQTNFPQNLRQVNALSEFAPFVALDMLASQWYQQRQLWLNSWQAVRSGQRPALQASNYWQKTLSLSDFLYLSQLMTAELGNLLLNLPVRQTDINWQKLHPMPELLAIITLQQTLEQIGQDRRQHIQEKLCYDKLYLQLATI